MDEAPPTQTIHDRLRMLRRYRLLIAAITLTAAGLALFLSARQEKSYSAEAQLQFHDVNQDIGLVGSVVQQADQPAALAAASASTLTREEVLLEVKRKLKSPLSIDDLRADVNATADPRSNLVIVDATGDTANGAADLANATAIAARDDANRTARRRFAIAARSLRLKIERLSSDDRKVAGAALQQDLTHNEALARFAAPAQVVVPAQVPSGPSSPKPIRNTLLAGFLGFFLALGIAFFASSLDRRLRNSQEIQGELSLPLIGHVREDLLGRSIHSAPGAKGIDLHQFEAFRILRVNLDFLDVDTNFRTVVVTSALPGEGKSTVAASLSMAAASMGARTLLVECDLRRPVLAERLGLRAQPGLTDYLIGQASPKDILQPVDLSSDFAALSNGAGPAVQEVAGGSLTAITCGLQNPRAAELLGSERFRGFLDQVKSVYDLVVIDTTPLLPVADTLSIVPHVDRVVLCVRASRTTRDQAQAGKDALERVPNVPPVGLVVTGEREHEESRYGGYAPYAYSYS